MNTPAIALPIRPDQTPLDEVMLAMDIVDTLRHDRSTVERELDADTRDETLVERIRQIYAGQGIEVTDDLIRKGVEALKQDRFAYVPPKPSFALRLAGAYVERWKWFRNSLIAGVLLSGGYVAMQLPQQWQDSRTYSAYEERVDDLDKRLRTTDQRIGALGRWHDAQSVLDGSASAAIGARVDAVATALQRVRKQRTTLEVVGKPVASTDYLAHQQERNQGFDRSLAQLAGMEGELSAVERSVQEADQLRALVLRFSASSTILSAADLQPAVQAEVSGVRQQAEGALRAGDVALAEPSVRRLEQIAAQLTQAYELRIVSQSGVKSGVWRYPVDNPDGRNYYLVVEAIGESGTPLLLPITNEETQQIQSVSRYAVRVPEAVYEGVKADKLDNGLIDAPLVGIKRRGELDVDFKVPVAGGYITEWDN